MAVGILLSRGPEQGQTVSQVASIVTLSSPADIAFQPNTAPVLNFKKIGSDLSVDFADGDTLRLINFFVVGPSGEFSRLIPNGTEVVVTGLMGPEAEGGDAQELAEDYLAVPSSGFAVSESTPVGGDNSMSGGEGSDSWSGSAIAAVVGLPLGSGLGSLFGGEDQPESEDLVSSFMIEPKEKELAETVGELTKDDLDALTLGETQPESDWMDLPNEGEPAKELIAGDAIEMTNFDNTNILDIVYFEMVPAFTPTVLEPILDLPLESP